mgnify:CR=1 FL=1
MSEQETKPKDQLSVNFVVDKENNVVRIEAKVGQSAVALHPDSQVLFVICNTKDEIGSLGVLEYAKQALHDYKSMQAMKAQQEEAIRKQLLKK